MPADDAPPPEDERAPPRYAELIARRWVEEAKVRKQQQPQQPTMTLADLDMARGGLALPLGPPPATLPGLPPSASTGDAARAPPHSYAFVNGSASCACASRSQSAPGGALSWSGQPPGYQMPFPGAPPFPAGCAPPMPHTMPPYHAPPGLPTQGMPTQGIIAPPTYYSAYSAPGGCHPACHPSVTSAPHTLNLAAISAAALSGLPRAPSDHPLIPPPSHPPAADRERNHNRPPPNERDGRGDGRGDGRSGGRAADRRIDKPPTRADPRDGDYRRDRDRDRDRDRAESRPMRRSRSRGRSPRDRSPRDRSPRDRERDRGPPPRGRDRRDIDSRRPPDRDRGGLDRWQPPNEYGRSRRS